METIVAFPTAILFWILAPRANLPYSRLRLTHKPHRPKGAATGLGLRRAWTSALVDTGGCGPRPRKFERR